MFYLLFVVHPALGCWSVDPAVLDGYVDFGFVVFFLIYNLLLLFLAEVLLMTVFPQLIILIANLCLIIDQILSRLMNIHFLTIVPTTYFDLLFVSVCVFFCVVMTKRPIGRTVLWSVTSAPYMDGSSFLPYFFTWCVGCEIFTIITIILRLICCKSCHCWYCCCGFYFCSCS